MMWKAWASSWSWKWSCGTDQSDAEGQAIAEDLMARLGVRKEDLLEGAYMDLLEKSV